MQQIVSVNKIIGDLDYSKIPQLIVLNKTDILAEGEARQLSKADRS